MSRKNGNNNSVDLDIGTLSGHLWEAANILRGPVDAADFKTYSFPLLFFKRLSDVYDEEYAVALEESDGDVEFARFPENHRFQVPEGCHWKDVRAKSANIGHALQKALGKVIYVKYQVKDQDLFDKAFGYIRQYY
jgi:type I restriction enzyme M protein